MRDEGDIRHPPWFLAQLDLKMIISAVIYLYRYVAYALIFIWMVLTCMLSSVSAESASVSDIAIPSQATDA